MTLLMAGLTIQCQQNEQDAIALKMIEGMQGALHLNRLTQQQLATSANPQMTDSLMLQINESKSLFTRLVDEYIENLGQVYEKKSGLFGGYRTSYYIASKTDQSLAITPNQYTALVQTLQDAAQQSDWGKTIKIMFPVTSHENSGMLEKDLSLNEIIAALKQVPLPTNYYSTAAYAGQIALGAAAIAGSAYLLYNNMDMNDLRILAAQVGNYFEPELNHGEFMLKMEKEGFGRKAPAVEAKPTFLQNAKSGVRRGLLGNEVVTVPGAQAGGDQENYSLSGKTGQEAIGTVATGLTGLTPFIATVVPAIHDLRSKRDALEDELKANRKNPEEIKDESESSFLNGALEALFGHEVKTVPGWHGGGDAEIYGAPGVSGEELNDALNIYMLGSGVGSLATSGVNAVKTGVNTVRNYVGSVGTAAGNAAATGASLGMAEASGLAAQAGQAAVKAAPARVAGQAGSVSPNWATNFENLPGGYVKSIPNPITTVTKKPISPRWEANFENLPAGYLQ